MTRQELWEYELEVGTWPNGPLKFRQQELIEMAKHGVVEQLEKNAQIKEERDDYRDQVEALEAKMESEAIELQ